MSSFINFESEHGIWQEERPDSISQLSNTDGSAQNVPSYSVPRILSILLDEENTPMGCTQINLEPIIIKLDGSIG